jgi:hypothetical protein
MTVECVVAKSRFSPVVAVLVQFRHKMKQGRKKHQIARSLSSSQITLFFSPSPLNFLGCSTLLCCFVWSLKFLFLFFNDLFQICLDSIPDPESDECQIFSHRIVASGMHLDLVGRAKSHPVTVSF